MAAKDLMLSNGWAIGFSKDVLMAALERGGEHDRVFDVEFALDAADAAAILREDLFTITDNWKGSEADIRYIEAFVSNF